MCIQTARCHIGIGQLPLRVLASILLLSLLSAVGSAAEQFLTLPFRDSAGVEITEGWVYDEPGPFWCEEFGDRCHKGVDYARPNGEAFEILAAADGIAVASRSPGGYGYFIFVRHEFASDGLHYFTLSAHVERGSWVTPFRALAGVKADIEAGDFSAWMPVLRGQKLATAGQTGIGVGVHLHFEVDRGGYALNKTDPYDIEDTLASGRYPADCGSRYVWTECPPIHASTEPRVRYLRQNAPGEVGKDIWTTSVFCYCDGGGGPGGGLDNEALVVGGWGDLYWALLQFDLRGLPSVAAEAYVELQMYQTRSGVVTPITLRRAIEDWDWRLAGSGSDLERLWWADRPDTEFIRDLPQPVVGERYRIDITDLYNAWKAGTYENYGIVLNPPDGSNRWAEFYSSGHSEPQLRPRLVVIPVAQ